MKKIFTLAILFLSCAISHINAQEKVTIRLNGSGGLKTITDSNGNTSNQKLTVEKGSLVTLTADGNVDGETHEFAFFTIGNTYKNGGTIVSNKNPYKFIAEASATYYMNFIGFGFDGTTLDATVNVTAAEGGKTQINGVPAGHMFRLGDEIDITATADEGYEFVNWTDAEGNVISTEARYTGVVSENAPTYTANFASTDTSIEAVSENKEYSIYDLRGNKVEKITGKGIYIVNGKATVVK